MATEFFIGNIQGPEGPQGPVGPGVKILGEFPTLEELTAVHPEGSEFDGGFLITSFDPARYFYWNQGLSSWEDGGPLQGERGPQGNPTTVNNLTGESITLKAQDIPLESERFPESETVAEGMDALSKALDEVSSDAENVTVNPITGLVSDNVQKALEEVFAMTTQFVAPIIAEATGSDAHTLQDQAAYIMESKEVGVTRLEERGVTADVDEKLDTIFDKIKEIGFYPAEINPNTHERVTYEEDIRANDLLAIRQSVKFEALTDFGGLPSGVVQCSAISKDKSTVVLLNDRVPYLVVYKKNKYDAFSPFAYPDPQPGVGGAGVTTTSGVAVSSDGTYIAASFNTSPFLRVWYWDGEQYVHIGAGNFPPTGECRKLRFSSDDTMLAVSTTVSPFFMVYEVLPDQLFKFENPPVIAAGAGRDVAFSRDSGWLAVAQDTVGGRIYKLDIASRTFSETVTPLGWLGGNGYSVDWNATGEYVVFGMSASPYLNVYRLNRQTLATTRLDNPSLLPTGGVSTVRFSDDGNTYFAGSFLYSFSGLGVSTRFPTSFPAHMTSVLWYGDPTPNNIITFDGTSPFRRHYTIDPGYLTFQEDIGYGPLQPYQMKIFDRILVVTYNVAPWLRIYDIQEDGSLELRTLGFAYPSLRPTSFDLRSDGESLALVYEADPWLRVVNLRTNAVFIPVNVHGRASYSVAWGIKSPNKLLVGMAATPSTGGQTSVALYNFSNETLTYKIAVHGTNSFTVARKLLWHPTSDRIFVLYENHSVYTGVVNVANDTMLEAMVDLFPAPLTGTGAAIYNMEMTRDNHIVAIGNSFFRMFIVNPSTKVTFRDYLNLSTTFGAAPGAMLKFSIINNGNYILAYCTGWPFIAEVEIAGSEFVQRSAIKNLLPSAIVHSEVAPAYDERTRIAYFPAHTGFYIYRLKVELNMTATKHTGDLFLSSPGDFVQRMALAIHDGEAGEVHTVYSLANIVERDDV